ncbi:phenylalanine ammonium lyase [Exidia glandulosa HHB12029]|uniref:Phenylalanine ammonium lyase n=1 Tax=Exidia glandulosa HHB12029 TaxID=1314781 RepID=A0A165D5A2_EXIGL|nr:phenylalanine ammonium lyase [Exidia glandulosa HHB12029]
MPRTISFLPMLAQSPLIANFMMTDNETLAARVEGAQSDGETPSASNSLLGSPTQTSSADTSLENSLLRETDRLDRLRPYPGILPCFLDGQAKLQELRRAKQPVSVDGRSLSVPALVVIARYDAEVKLDDRPDVKDAVLASRKALEDKLKSNTSIYGVSTGFGGSANTRTSHFNALGASLLQHHHSGILPLPNSQADLPLPLGDDYASLSMPVSWVRGAMVVRMNSLARGHSGVRWETVEQLGELVNRGVTPLVPLRGSISASGDLTPLAYVAGAISGHPHIRVRTRTPGEIVRASDPKLGLPPLRLQDKENLGIMNGTAFSAALGALAVHESVQLALLAQVCTALGTEALLGTQASHVPFIHDVCRPHPGQVECARTIHELLEGSGLATTGAVEKEVTIQEDGGHLRQDRYPLRTAAQYLGPWTEDILAAHATVTLECNTTTDNPLIDGTTGHVHHGGNFQAMAVTSAMEKTRLALFHVGKLLFAQLTELLNPLLNNGLPPSVAASEPSTDYHAKGLDINAASYVSEMGYLANPVSTHVQSAEMHNQAVNSLAFISARQTLTAIDVLSMLVSTYLYVLCQAIDIRVLQAEFSRPLPDILDSLLVSHFSISSDPALIRDLKQAIHGALLTSSTQDTHERMLHVAEASSLPLYRLGLPAVAVQAFVTDLSATLETRYNALRLDFLAGARGELTRVYMAPKTRKMYTFIREELGISMHGLVNSNGFLGKNGETDFGERSVGESVSVIYDAIRSGRVEKVLAGIFCDA